MTTKSRFVALTWMALSASSWAGPILTVTQTDNDVIPDNDPNGLVEIISPGSSIASIANIQLTLDLGAAPGNTPFNGDYYAYLSHGPTLVVLLDQVGVTSGNPYGYADEGFNVTLSDGNPDIHNYQNGPYTLNSNGQLTGTWAPDGGSLSSFDGQSSGGDWVLFVADLSPGSEGNLDSWSLQFTGNSAAVPDRASTLGLLILATSPFALRSWRKRRHMR